MPPRRVSSAIAALRKLPTVAHPCVVAHYAFTPDPDRSDCVRVVAELMDGGSLFALVHTPGSPTSTASLLQLLCDGWVAPTLIRSPLHVTPAPFPRSAMGVAHLHDRGVVHGAVSTAAVLVRVSQGILPRAAVVDSRPKRLLRRGRRGDLCSGQSPLWAAPEVLCGEPASPASDVFSLCVAIHETATRREVWHGPSDPGTRPAQLLARVVVGGERPDDAASDAAMRAAGLAGTATLRDVLRRGWSETAAERPAAGA